MHATISMTHLARNLAAVAVLTASLAAQEGQTAPTESPTPSNQTVESEPASPFVVPSAIADAIEVDAADMRERLADAPLDELQAVLRTWANLVRRQQSEYQTAIKAPEGSKERDSADAIGTDRDALIARAEAVIELVVEKGGDVTSTRDLIRSIRDSEAQQTSAQAGSTVPQDQTIAQTIPLEVLRAQLRPLRVEQVEAELTAWLEILQRKCLEVRKAEVAGLRTEDSDEADKFESAAVEVRSQRDALIKRVKVVVDAFETKAGAEDKVAEHRAFLASIVAKPPLTGVRALWVTFRTWLFNPEGGIALGIAILTVLGILVGFRLLAAALSRLLNRALRTFGRTPELLRGFLVNTVSKLIMVVGIIVALGQIGVSVAPVLAAIGGAAFIIGFALQGTLSNFASGLMLLMYRPYNVGDVVEAGGASGTVAGQNLVSTTIKTFDNKVIMIPNNKIWGDIITNSTASNQRRVDLVFGIGYGDDIAAAEAALWEVVRADERVLSTPETTIKVHELGDSSVKFIVRPWVKTADYWAVYWSITRAVKERFDAEGITIPFPQRDVHVYHEAVGDRAMRAALPT